MKQKLNAKDFILIGVLTALMWIICMIISTIMSVAGPVTNVFYPSVVAIPNGIVMMLLLAKVPKKGVFTICAAIQAILFLLVGAFWFIPIGLIIGGVICDFLVMSRNEITMKSMMTAMRCSVLFLLLVLSALSNFFKARLSEHGEKQYCSGVHSGNVEHYFRSHAGSHCCCRIGGRSDWWLYRSESIEKTLYQSWTCFSKITGSAP